ncbi:winged helix-turn-helix domain-containing protein [Muricoccus nepalensis]|uniref:winged helix-turn-helix domain-containing protein n=1 Tax=Muricoccus nepalensis TaxID=1854500 RepID=UPI00112D1020|nr:winged helix-turn-helix domain-containing protein [Roseomonas nepalensis]
MTVADHPSVKPVLAALHRPGTLASLSSDCGRTVGEVTHSLLLLLRSGRAVAYCRDHYILRDLHIDYMDKSSADGHSASRRIMAALGRAETSTTDLHEGTGLPEDEIHKELAALSRIGAVTSARRGQVRFWWRSDALAAKVSRRRRVEHMAAQGAALALFEKPCRSGEVARLIGYRASVMNNLLLDLLHNGQITRVERGQYALSTATSPATAVVPRSHSWPGGCRPQPVRDAILLNLTEPRQAVDIARAIGRTVPNVTGHLRAMMELGLVERVGYGRYALPGTPGLPPVEQRSFCRPGTPTASAKA